MSDFTELHKAFTYERDGAKTAVLFIHGICGSPHIFAKLTRDIQRMGANVFAILLPGHGASAREFSMARERDWQKSVEDELTRLEGLYERVIVIGHSMGGLIGILQSFRHAIDGLVLINTPMHLRPSLTQITMGTKVFLGRFYENREMSTQERIYRETFGIELANPAQTALWIPQITDLFRLISRAKKRLWRVTCPTLIVQSELDETVHHKSARELAAKISTAKDPVYLKKSLHAYFDIADYELMSAKISAFILQIE